MNIRVFFVAALLLSGTAFADRIAIIGTGDVAAALGPEFAAQGHTIVYGSRDPERSAVQELVANTSDGASATTPRDAAEQADIIVLAVPGMLVADVTRGLGDLAGKIIIDQAKQKVAALIAGMGLEAIDVGPVENAHWVEGMLILWINNRYGSERQNFDYHLRKN